MLYRAALPFIAAAMAVAPAAAQQAMPEPTPRIVVSGTGEAALAPDMATLSLTVLRQGDTARAALDANNKAMAEVLAAMKEAGIAERDLQTSGFSINPRYVYPQNNDGATPPRITGYDVTNTITVRVRDLARLGEIIDKSVDLGVNQGGQVDFGNADSKPALAEARAKAVEDAVARATTLATAAKVRIGRILEMTENSYNPGPVPIARTMAMKAEADAVPMAAGENAYSVTVNVTFAIDQ